MKIFSLVAFIAELSAVARWHRVSPRHYQSRSAVVTRRSGPVKSRDLAGFGEFSMSDMAAKLHIQWATWQTTLEPIWAQ